MKRRHEVCKKALVFLLAAAAVFQTAGGAERLYAAEMAADESTETVSATEEKPLTQIATGEDGKQYVYNIHKRAIAQVQGDGSLLFILQADAHANGAAIELLLSNDDEKTIVFPAAKIETDRAIKLHSNTHIIATSANIIQTNKQKQLIYHDCDALDYASLQNVSIKGGTWSINGNEDQERSTSTFRFAHASDIQITNCTIKTNYISHALELIACKDVTVSGCKLIAYGTPEKTSLEEALQIDLATKATAPTVANYGEKYVKGQTCDNITVKNCTISGSRGLCANKTDTEKGKWLGKFHTNITITGCKITGVSSEGVALHNTIGFTVKNNTIVSKSSRTDEIYSTGLSVAMFAENSKSTKYQNVISKNTIKGGRNALHVASYEGSKFGKTTIKSNKFFAKAGADKGYEQYFSKDWKQSVYKKLVYSGNKSRKWNA